MACVESLYKRNNLSPYIFSEQQIVDCTVGLYRDEPKPINNGCSGGTSDAVTQYFNDAHVETQEDYPYKAKDAPCAVKQRPSRVKFNHTTVLPENEDHLAYLLNKNGPLVLYIYAGKT